MQTTAGFQNYTLDSLTFFRSLMRAMSFPGCMQSLPKDLLPQDSGLPAAAAAVALTLFDNDTSVWLAPDYNNCREWLVFHTGCRLAANSQADFAVLKARDFNNINDFVVGTANYPDNSTTVVLNGVRLGRGERFLAQGPGIDGSVTFSVEGLPENFLDIWAENTGMFPLGIDLLLIDNERLVALPRTTRLKKEL